jgi:hypothetical protein
MAFLGCSIPQVLMDGVLHPPADGPALSLYVSSTNTIFLFVAVCVAYGMVSPPAGFAVCHTALSDDGDTDVL